MKEGVVKQIYLLTINNTKVNRNYLCNKEKYLKGVINMSEFRMRAMTFKNKFGVAPCDCWKNSYRPGEYHIDPVYKSMGNFGNPRTEEVIRN